MDDGKKDIEGGWALHQVPRPGKECKPVIPAPWRLGQKDQMFKPSLGSIARHWESEALRDRLTGRRGCFKVMASANKSF